MKTFFSTILLSTVLLSVSAQDLIVKNDKTEIKAKIEELTETTIKYKKFEMLDGPTYNINKRDIFMIIYKNGSKEYMEVSKPEEGKPINSQVEKVEVNSNSNIKGIPGNHGQLTKSGGVYYFEGNPVRSQSEIKNLFNKYGYTDLIERTQQAKLFGYISSGAGIVLLVVGLAAKSEVALLSGLGVGLGGAIIGGGMSKKIIKDFNVRANKKLGYNSKIELKPIMYSSNSVNHVGLNIKF